MAGALLISIEFRCPTCGRSHWWKQLRVRQLETVSRLVRERFCGPRHWACSQRYEGWDPGECREFADLYAQQGGLAPLRTIALFDPKRTPLELTA